MFTVKVTSNYIKLIDLNGELKLSGLKKLMYIIKI